MINQPATTLYIQNTKCPTHFDPHTQWRRLSNGQTPWFEKADECYIYYNRGDGQWWIDGTDGLGVYVSGADLGGDETVDWARLLPPREGWEALTGGKEPLPVVEVVND
jgi:hypothetical protein